MDGFGSEPESWPDWRLLLDAAPDSVLISDGAGKIVYANQTTARLFGYSREELVGLDHDVLVPDANREVHRVKRDEYLREPYPRFLMHGEGVRAKRRDGTSFDAVIALSPIQTAQGPLILVICHEVSEHPGLAPGRNAQELSRLREFFLSTLSHELKTPLALILGYAELLQDKYPEEPLILGVLDGARRLSTHLDTMLLYASALGAGVKVSRTEVPVAEVLDKALAMLSAGFEERHVALDWSVAPGTPAAYAEPRHFLEILLELIGNAFKFTPEHGRISVRAFPEDGKPVVTVVNTSAGIPDHIVARIFEPYGRHEPATSRFSGGLGLGLAVARRLTEINGGSLTVDSKGGEVRFTLILEPFDPGDR